MHCPGARYLSLLGFIATVFKWFPHLHPAPSPIFFLPWVHLEDGWVPLSSDFQDVTLAWWDTQHPSHPVFNVGTWASHIPMTLDAWSSYPRINMFSYPHLSSYPRIKKATFPWSKFMQMANSLSAMTSNLLSVWRCMFVPENSLVSRCYPYYVDRVFNFLYHEYQYYNKLLCRKLNLPISKKNTS